MVYYKSAPLLFQRDMGLFVALTPVVAHNMLVVTEHDSMRQSNCALTTLQIPAGQTEQSTEQVVVLSCTFLKQCGQNKKGKFVLFNEAARNALSRRQDSTYHNL